MAAMQHDDTRHIDCHTCVASGTTACSDCIVGHLLANDEGPIELRVVQPGPHDAPARPDVAPLTDDTADTADDVGRVIELFSSAGLLDDPPYLVSADEFAAASSRHPSAGPRR